jgi:hypothetical protein
MSKSRYINPAEEIKHTGPYIAQCKWADRTGPQNFFLGGGGLDCTRSSLCSTFELCNFNVRVVQYKHFDCAIPTLSLTCETQMLNMFFTNVESS